MSYIDDLKELKKTLKRSYTEYRTIKETKSANIKQKKPDVEVKVTWLPTSHK